MENIIRNQEGIDKGHQGKKEWRKPCLIMLSIKNTQLVDGPDDDGDLIGS